MAEQGKPPRGESPRIEVAPLPPEASSRFVQTVMLGLSVLLLGIAAVLFVGVITDLEPWSQLVILAGVVVLALLTAPPVARRGLTATAETVAVVGLLVVGVAGYAWWRTGLVVTLPGPVYGALVAATTAAVGYGYHLLTHLQLPRWLALLALQPVLPLLALPWVTGATGWALVFTLVAAHNAALATVTGPRALGYAGWVLHAAAVAAALGFSTAGLILASNPLVALGPAVSLVVAAAVAVAGAGAPVGLRRFPLPDIAAGLLALAVIGSAGRVLALALPGRALLPVTAVAALTAAAIRLLPAPRRKGPLLAVAVVFGGIGVLVAGLALRAGTAVLVLPAWPADLSAHQQALAAAGAATTGWQLFATAAALTIGAALVPWAGRRESTVVGGALTALSVPASLNLPLHVVPWVLVVAVAAVALTGLDVVTRRAAIVHVAAASVAAVAAVGAGLAYPALTAAVLAALTVTGAVLAGARGRTHEAGLVKEWAAGVATLALPGAATTAALAAGADTAGVLVAGFAAVCASLGYAVGVQLRHRFLPIPVRIGAALGMVLVGAFAVTAGDATALDRGIVALLALTTALVLGAGRMDSIQRPDRLLDGADLAAAALTTSVIATLARLAGLLLPVVGADAALATAATLVLAVTCAVRAVPPAQRRGPVLGVAAAGALLTALAGAAAVASGFRVLAQPGPVWQTDLARWWPPEPGLAGLTWGTPLGLGLLAIAAAVLLPRPYGSRSSAALAVLAVLATPAALPGLPWWGPAALATVAAISYGLSAAWPDELNPRAALGLPGELDPRASVARAGAGGAIAVYAAGAALARPGTTAAVLALLAVVGAAVAWLLRRATDQRAHIGGVAVTGALLAGPAALAALAAQLALPANLLLQAALAGSTLGLAVFGYVRVVPYLPYGTAGVAAGATGVAFFALPAPHAAGVYAAAAVLLAVLAELVRAARLPPGFRSLVRPPVGALVAAAVPAVIAVIDLAPTLATVLLGPYQTLTSGVWAGPPPALADPGPVAPTSVLAALLLTVATALAAVGFGGTVTRQAVPLVAPGLAITMLITPAALGAPWPASTGAGLAVFTMAVLGVALTPPPARDPATRPLRIARVLVLGIGLAAGGSGLAGALADPLLTWATFGGAIAVGAVAALGGATAPGRLLGWLGATLAAQLFALTTASLLDATAPQAGFGLLAVAAVALLGVARLRRLSARERAAVEWLGGGVSLAGAVVLAAGSRPELTALLLAAGAVLALAALAPGRPHRWRRVLLWTAAASEVAAWAILMRLVEVDLLEAYTLPFAVFALLVGGWEVRSRPELGSWFTWGPGLLVALVPSLLVVLISPEPQPARHGYVLLAGVAAILAGSWRRPAQQAPVTIGAIATAIAALHLLSLAGPWLVLIPLGLLLLFLGATRERRARDLQRWRGMR